MPGNRRYDARRDAAEKPIVEALEAAGCQVWRDLPCDLLVRVRGRWELLEAKTPQPNGKMRNRKDQQEQAEFCAANGVPYVTTPEQALRALGLIYGYTVGEL